MPETKLNCTNRYKFYEKKKNVYSGEITNFTKCRLLDLFVSPGLKIFGHGLELSRNCT